MSGNDYSPPESLRRAASIYEERNKLYGDNYKRIGEIMMQLFPEGLHLKTKEDFNRFCCYGQAIYKLTRYAQQFLNGGHADSLDDLSVYAQMLNELDHPQQAVPFVAIEGNSGEPKLYFWRSVPIKKRVRAKTCEKAKSKNSGRKHNPMRIRKRSKINRKGQ